MKITYSRPLMVFFLVLMLFLLNTQTAYAADTPADLIDQYNREIMYWYRLLLQNVFFPLEIVSFASCGFRLLFAGFLNNSKSLDNVKNQIVMSIVALAVAIMLPTLIGWGVAFFRDTGWQPKRYDVFGEEVTNG